jgi:uncharacterized membrane protein
MNMDIVKTIILIPLIDAFWLRLISDKFNKQIMAVQYSEMKIRVLPIIGCYVALIFGLYYFVIRTNETRKQKILNAFLLGMVINAVYETTNYATLDKWAPDIVIMDIIWGGILLSLTTFLVTFKL